MNFLELCKRVRQECGIAGDGPITTVGQTKEMKRIVDWTSQAWVDIQNARADWDFMRTPVTFNTVAGQQVYAPGAGKDIPITDFKRWRNESFRQYLQSAGVGTEVILGQYQSYSEFRDFYLLGSRRLVTGRPLYITITPERSLALGFTPNDVYVTTAEYYRKAQILAADTDVPNMEEDYHMLIVYGAMKKYGIFEVANEQVATAKEEYTILFNRLELEFTPVLEMGDSFI
jgi:hypothetical protein